MTMKRSPIHRRSLLNAGRAALGFAAVATLSVDGLRGAAAAVDECYDFSVLDSTARFEIGDTIVAEHSVVEFKEFLGAQGNPSQSENQFANVSGGSLADGISAPELRMYLINALMTPNQPVRKVRFNFAESLAGVASNLSVNGDTRVLPNGMPEADQREIGTAGVGVALVTVTSTVVGNFTKGTIELEAVSGRIESIGFGGHVFYVDDYCIRK